MEETLTAKKMQTKCIIYENILKKEAFPLKPEILSIWLIAI